MQPEVQQVVMKVLETAAELYKLGETTEVSVTLTDNAHIKELNAKYRNKDFATDVLSFALREGDEPAVVGGMALELLGDIIISLERAKEQALEYGHTLEREMAFLTAHGMLHLLGYDHLEEEERSEMRREEEFLLHHLGITRGL